MSYVSNFARGAYGLGRRAAREVGDFATSGEKNVGPVAAGFGMAIITCLLAKNGIDPYAALFGSAASISGISSGITSYSLQRRKI